MPTKNGEGGQNGLRNSGGVSPLIPESLVLFYRRMAKAFRSPPPPDAVAIAGLSRVVELHHRAAAAIQAAVERSVPGGQKQLQDLCSEETRLAHAIGELVTELGGSPPSPEESSQQLPRDPRSMSYARGQAELMGFVREDLDYVANAHLELAGISEIPIVMHRRLKALLGDAHNRSTAVGAHTNLQQGE
jgi:hypothetical protein